EGRASFKLIGQVNSELPFMPGAGDLPADEFSALLESPATDFPLFAPPAEPVSDTKYAIGLHAASLVPDGGTLQIGIGQVGDALAQALIVRHRDNVQFHAIMKRLAPGAAPGGSGIADGLEDGQVVSGVGGLYKFVGQAFALEGARAVVALESTRQAGRKTLSNMRWNYEHQTIPRHLRDAFVTEYGVADVRGKSDAETIAAMLAVTDSRFQDELAGIAKDAGKLPKEFEIPRSHRENFPERIAHALKPARDAGLLPSFPFGSDFTEAEQRLIPALQLLREAQRTPLLLPGLLWQGIWQPPDASNRECLARLSLDRPTTFAERAYRPLVNAALVRSRAG